MSSAGRRKKGEGQGTIPTVKKYRPGGSCAECKRSPTVFCSNWTESLTLELISRLKIKCTKSTQDSFPCDPCIRRGCQSICPEGSLTSGKAGSRFVLANTEELHQKINELSSRVRDLEDALQELQAASSTEPHPLLRRDLLLVKAPLESDTSLAEGETSSSDPESLDARGSLSLRKFGRSNFHAQTAGSWYFLQNEESDPIAPQDEVDSSAAFPLPVDILYASHTFPMSTLEDTRHDLRGRIQGFIPDRDTAILLVDNYFHGMAWIYDPVPRTLFIETVFNAVYTSYFPIVRDCDSTVLSVFLTVLAIGTILDLNIPNYSPQATRYYHLARAALSLDLELDEPSMATIQALHLMGSFLHMSDYKGGFGTSWALMGLNVKMATGIGLRRYQQDRDSARWNLGEEDEIRRQLFWELYTYDTWQSMPCGRPPSFQRLTVDCKMPYITLLAPSAIVDDPGSVFKAWKHRFCYERISPMVEQAFGPRTPSYSTILLLDRKIREDPVPPLLQLSSTLDAAPSPTDHANVSLTMQRYAVLCVREISLLLMHRPFFAQAVTEKTPLETKFAPSILAVYRSSCSIIASVRALYDQQPRLSPRIWFFWAHAYSATICLGGLVVRCPSLSLAGSALSQVDSACELFSKVMDSNRATKSLPSMLKLRDKARHALSQFGAGHKARLVIQPGQDELSALVGETRLVVHRKQLPSPEESIAACCTGSAILPDAQSIPAPTSGTFYNGSSGGMDDHADQGSISSPPYPADAVSSYITPNSSGGYSELRSDLGHFPVASVPFEMQDEYYLPQREPLNPEQQVFTQQGGCERTWQNFMSHLDMEVS